MEEFIDKNEKRQNTIEKRKLKQQGLLLEQLLKTPIVQIACEKTGIARPTYYRWRNENSTFANQADAFMAMGKDSVNDLAESVIMRGIKNNDFKSARYWLSHNKPEYQTSPILIEKHLKEKEQEKLKVVVEMVRDYLHKNPYEFPEFQGALDDILWP